jgi:hypothetical protein
MSTALAQVMLDLSACGSRRTDHRRNARGSTASYNVPTKKRRPLGTPVSFSGTVFDVLNHGLYVNFAVMAANSQEITCSRNFSRSQTE